MKQYLIDGNNVIGKMADLKKLQQTDPQASRERLAHIIDRFFSGKKFKVYLHFDGHPKDAIRTGKIRIVYSHDLSADTEIRRQIENSKNPKHFIVVTSDRALSEFAKVCSCTVEASESLIQKIIDSNRSDIEEDIINDISDDEIKRLFDL